MLWKNTTKEVTLGQAVNAYKNGIVLEVNDGKDITVKIEKEPTTDQDD